MNLHLLLGSLSSRGIRLSKNKEDGALLVDAPKGMLTPDLRDLLVEYKPQILTLLDDRDLAPSDRQLPTIVPDRPSRHEPFPLTDMQHAFWIGRSGVLELGNVSNHGYYEIEGEDLEPERLEIALQTAIARHDMLRAIVRPDGQQQILESVPPYALPVLDLRDSASADLSVRNAAEITAELDRLRQLLSHQNIPSDRWPLFDFRLTRLPNRRSRLHISFDLLVFDAWSLFRLFEEWFALYQNPGVALPQLELSFRDYALAEQELTKTELYARSRDYWLDRIDTLPPAPDLPLAKNPQEIKEHRCRRYSTQMSPPDWTSLKQKAVKAGLTPSGLLIAAFAEVLGRWSQTPKFTLNLALFNRLPMHEQVNQILGDFTSVTLLAIDRTGPESFRERAEKIQTQLWQDLEHRYFSGVRVTREIARRKGEKPRALPVIFTSTLGFAAMGQETRTFGHFGELVYGISQASQAWMDVQISEENGTLHFNWDVVEELFPEGLIQDMFETYCRFLNDLANSDELWTATDIPLLPPAQETIRKTVNETDAPVAETFVQELFLTQVQQQPDAIAVIAPHCQLTYQELFDRANTLGHQLRERGAKPNQPIAIVMEKGWEQIVAVMGILLAGAACVPIAPGLPKERLQYLLDNSQTPLVLTQSQLLDTLPDLGSRPCLTVDTCEPRSLATLKIRQAPDDLSHIIYTSGSTGLPKGVAIIHRALTNTIVYTNQRFELTASDRILALTALNHDMSTYDILGLLSAGGAIVLPEAQLHKDPSHWAELIDRQGVTLWNSVPALLEILVDTLEDPAIATVAMLSRLRLGTLGGDWLPLSLFERIRQFAPEIQLYSVGGPTETTIWNICYPIDRVEPHWKSIPYGQPMTNVKYHILNAVLEDCPTWVSGQMYCSGVQLAQGYWQNPEKTAASFIRHPRTGERLYGTGDRGRYLPDGNIEFLGRIDFQIELRGYRIEPGEIESTLARYPSVRSAAVQAVGHGKQARLVAYLVVEKGETPPEIATLSQWLKDKLPDYMIPFAFVFLEALPLSANGKVDRRALPTDEALFTKVEAAYAPPENEIEQAIAAVFEAALDLDRVGVNDNFFDMGANSLLLTVIYRKLNETFPAQAQAFSLVDLFNYTTIKSLAQKLASADKSESHTARNKAMEQKLNRGKRRLKQRLQRSRSA
ncbi:MAG: amino acid adenylation domain-containing protein [Cyanobacteria bacterium P01_G01_bin.54]